MDCPFCGKVNKFAVHFGYGVVKCWVCLASSGIVTFVEEIEGVNWKQAKDILLTQPEIRFAADMVAALDIPKDVVNIELPYGYTPLLSGDGMMGKRARNYMRSRGFDVEMLDSRGFGYCGKHHEDERKDYYGYIVIPYKRDERLVYYQCRDYLGGGRMRYKNPPVDAVGGVGKSDVLYNEDALYMFDDIYITEGWADAETLYPQGTATSGWTLSTAQKRMYHNSTAKRLIFVPDAGVDGTGVSFYKKAVKAAMEFMSSKEVRVVDITGLGGKDVNEIGRKNIVRQARATKPLTWSSAMDILMT